jgi:hypothetical protein
MFEKWPVVNLSFFLSKVHVPMVNYSGSDAEAIIPAAARIFL